MSSSICTWSFGVVGSSDMVMHRIASDLRRPVMAGAEFSPGDNGSATAHAPCDACGIRWFAYEASSTRSARVGTGLDSLRPRGDSTCRPTDARRRILDHIQVVTADFLVEQI